MNDEVKFIKLSEEKYQSLENKDPSTFYNTGSNMYVGNILLSTNIESNGDVMNNNSSLTTVVGGIAPKSCKDLNCVFDDDNDVLKFTWKDVDDAYWGGVRLVVKKDSAPENFEDGDIIKDIYVCNAHSTTPLEVPIVDSGTYYATLFPFSTTKCVNSLKVSHINLNVINTKNPVSFAEDDWDMICRIAKEGTASTWYHVGDTKPLACLDGNTYTMEIKEIDSNGHITLEAQELCEETYDNISTSTGWVDRYDAKVYVKNKAGTSYYLRFKAAIPNPDDIEQKLSLIYDKLPENIKSNVIKVNSDFSICGDVTINTSAYTSNGYSYYDITCGPTEIIRRSNFTNYVKNIINTNTPGKYMGKYSYYVYLVNELTDTNFTIGSNNDMLFMPDSTEFYMHCVDETGDNRTQIYNCEGLSDVHMILSFKI